MNEFQIKIRDWHDKFGVSYRDTPGIPSDDVKILRNRLIFEEVHELLLAIAQDDLIEIADAIADSLYVIIGTAVAYGIDCQRVFDEVHRSNLTKVWSDGTVHRDEFGKVIKPPGFQKPDIASALKEE